MSQPDVFLSSSFKDFMEVRQRIRELAPDRFWMSEIERQDLDTRKGVAPFEIVDALVDQIKASSLFICVLHDRYGSSVLEQIQSVSFLETEIYEAAVFHSDVHFFLLEPFKPDRELQGLISVVKAIRPGVIPEKAVSEAAILEGIKRILDSRSSRRRTRRGLPLGAFVGQLAARRGHPLPDVELFNGVFAPISSSPDLEQVESLLEGLGGEARMDRRLTRMWVALRELSSAPYDQARYESFRPAWRKALAAWSSSAAWYGLHGHLYAGRLAAVNSILKIDSLRNGRPDDPLIERGGRASEYYSIAKLCPTSRQRMTYFNLALGDVQAAMAAHPEDPSGLLSIRGHIRLRLGDPKHALADFQSMLEHREGMGEGLVGEALADIGIAEVKLGRRREGLMRLQEAVGMLEAAGRHTFAVRAQKALAWAYAKNGRMILGVKELCDAYERAEKHELRGQITPWMDRVYRMACRVGVWRRRREGRA